MRRPIPYHEEYEVDEHGVVYGKLGQPLKVHRSGKVRLDTGFHDPYELRALAFPQAAQEVEEVPDPAPPAPKAKAPLPAPRSALKESVVLARQRGLTDEDIADALGVQVVTIRSLFV